VIRVGREQPVQGRRSASGQPGHEDRAIDGNGGILGAGAPRGLGQQAGRQRGAQADASDLAAERGQVGVARVRFQDHGQAVAVIVGAEVRQPGQPGGGLVQVLDGPDVDAIGAGH
jgi:hypothetical protein